MFLPSERSSADETGFSCLDCRGLAHSRLRDDLHLRFFGGIGDAGGAAERACTGDSAGGRPLAGGRAASIADTCATARPASRTIR